jgi:hypothetical protein
MRRINLAVCGLSLILGALARFLNDDGAMLDGRPLLAIFQTSYSGIEIVMLPNGVTYYYFSDNGEFVWYPAVAEAAKLAPLCR